MRWREHLPGPGPPGSGLARSGLRGSGPAGPRPALAWPALAGLLLGLLALGPALARGFLLSYDMVAVPRPPFTAAMFGLAGTLPRAVPSDAVAAVAALVLPADIVQKLLLLSIFVLASSGVAALLAGEHWLARLAGAAWYAWNPFVAERLIIGQWAMLLGYGGLPWVLRAVTRPAPNRWRWAARVTVALIPAAVGGFSAMCLSALIAIPAAACTARSAAGRAQPRARAERRDPGPRGESPTVPPAAVEPAAVEPAGVSPLVSSPLVSGPPGAGLPGGWRPLGPCC